MNKTLICHELWRRGSLSWKLHSAQKLIYDLIKGLDKDKREALIFCARRFGKSYLGCILALEDAIQNPGKQVAIVGPTFKQTKAIVTPLLKQILKDAPPNLVTQAKASSTWNLSNGSTLVLGGFDTISERLRGLDINSLYLEETGLATSDLEEFQYLIYSVLFPTLMHSKGRITHLTTPARIIDHPLHTVTLPLCQMNDSFYKFIIEQNPLLSSEDIAKEIENLGGIASQNVRRELFCEILRDEAITIVPTFDETLHVQPLTHEYNTYLVSGDMGYINDLSVFHLMGYCHTLGKVKVFEEKVFPPQTASSTIVAALKEWDKYKPTIVVDIQGNTRIDMHSFGLQAASPIKDKFESTITFIRNEFFQNKVIIDPKCKLLVQTLRSGTFNKQKTDFSHNITTGHCDALMSLIYGLRSVDKLTDLRPKPPKESIWTIPKPSPSKAILKAFN
jgi:Terminase large subunit, T4likevirus-type, N-terminal